jgi:predicted MFS family arabinose efflux permease
VPAGARPSRVGLGAALTVTMAVGPLVLFALSALSPLITRDLGLSVSEFGALSTVSFAVAAPSAWLLGRLVDRYAARRVMFAVFAGTAASLVVTSTAPSYLWLLAGVVLSGMAMSVTNPVTNQVVSLRVASGQRGPIMGAKQSGVQLGQFLVGLTLPPIAVFLGWRPAIAATAVLVLAGLVLTARFVPAGPVEAPAPRPAEARAGTPPQVWLLLAYSFLSGAALQATNTYLPLFAFERLSFSVASAGLTVSVVGGVGLLARIAWARAAERSGDPLRILAVMAAGGTVAMAVLVVTARAEVGALLWAAAALSGATVVASNVVVMMAVVRLADGQSVAGASGLLALGLYAGFAVGPVSFGLLVEAAGYPMGWLVAAALYAAAGLVIGVSQVRYSRQRPRVQPSTS